MKQESWTVKVR